MCIVPGLKTSKNHISPNLKTAVCRNQQMSPVTELRPSQSPSARFFEKILKNGLAACIGPARPPTTPGSLPGHHVRSLGTSVSTTARLIHPTRTGIPAPRELDPTAEPMQRISLLPASYTPRQHTHTHTHKRRRVGAESLAQPPIFVENSKCI